MTEIEKEVRNIYARYINCSLIYNIPPLDDYIYNYLDFDIKEINSICIFMRSKKECYLDRGNWVCTISLRNGEMQCFKLPIEMEQEAVMKFFKPLIDDFSSEIERCNETNFK